MKRIEYLGISEGEQPHREDIRDLGPILIDLYRGFPYLNRVDDIGNSVDGPWTKDEFPEVVREMQLWLLNFGDSLKYGETQAGYAYIPTRRVIHIPDVENRQMAEWDEVELWVVYHLLEHLLRPLVAPLWVTDPRRLKVENLLTRAHAANRRHVLKAAA